MMAFHRGTRFLPVLVLSSHTALRRATFRRYQLLWQVAEDTLESAASTRIHKSCSTTTLCYDSAQQQYETTQSEKIVEACEQQG